MPDITMCEGGTCPRKQECVRFTSTPNEYRQSFFVEVPVKEDGTCDYFWRDLDALNTKPSSQRG